MIVFSNPYPLQSHNYSTAATILSSFLLPLLKILGRVVRQFHLLQMHGDVERIYLSVFFTSTFARQTQRAYFKAFALHLRGDRDDIVMQENVSVKIQLLIYFIPC